MIPYLVSDAFKLSSHLSWAELACHDPEKTPYPTEWRSSRALVIGLEFEFIRQLAGDEPLTVLSAYRTEEWNKKIGGAVSSMHPQGLALDIVNPALSVKKLFNIVQARAEQPGSMIGGIGIYPSFVHFDCRKVLTLKSGIVIWQGGRIHADEPPPSLVDQLKGKE